MNKANMIVKNDVHLFLTLTARCTGLLKCQGASLLVEKSFGFLSLPLPVPSILARFFSSPPAHPIIQHLGPWQPLRPASLIVIHALLVVHSLSPLLTLEINLN